MPRSLPDVLRRLAVARLRAALARRRLELEELEPRETPAGVYTGTVFQDFNADGLRSSAATTPPNTDPNGGAGTTSRAVDRGIAGVTVRAYDPANTLRGTAVSVADGTFSLTATGAGPYRLEFDATTFPPGFVPGPHGTGPNGSGTTVQFVADGGGANANLGVVLPDDYAPNNPTLVTAQYNFGDQLTGPSATVGTIIRFPYTAGGNVGNPGTAPAPTSLVTGQNVGAVFGLGSSNLTGSLYASAFMKKHVGFGPAGTGAIYAIDPTTGATALFVDLNAVYGAGTAGADPHDPADYDRDNGNATWDAVGKVAFGGLDVSADGRFVFAMNLADRSLYRIPTTGPRDATTIVRTALPVPVAGMGVTGATAGNPLGDLRPFAVTAYRGQVYVGAVNSAQTTGARADLRAYVYRVNPDTMAFDPTPAFRIDDLTFQRGIAESFNGSVRANWQAWTGGYANLAPNPTAVYPQPMLSGLAFDAAGNMVLGVRDRAGDQFGFFTLDNPANGGARYEGVAGGDTMFAAANVPNNPAAGWTLESNGRVTTPGNVNDFGPTGGAGNGQGRGGGEYFFQDDHAPSGFHQEVSGGTVLIVPGHPDVVVSAFDPSANVRAGGFVSFDIATGVKTKGYQSYTTGGANSPTVGVTFSKANGLGEVTTVPDRPPIEVGNRVFRDADGDGLQDAGEAGIPGVTVRLYAAGGVLLGTTTTDAGGNYYFSSRTTAGLASGATYSIRIDEAADFAPGGPLAGLRPTRIQSTGNAATDSDGAAAGATDVRAGLTAAPFGASNHTADFGFTPPVQIGNRVWTDTDNDGDFDAGVETGIVGVPVRLLEGNAVIASTTTGAGGLYLFTNQLPGTYRVEIAPPTGFVSSTGTVGSLTGPVEPVATTNNTDERDHGTQTGAVIRTPQFEVFGAGNVANPDAGASGPNSANLRQDFGVIDTYYTLAGNVYNDANDNGLIDAGEALVTGQPVTFTLAGTDYLGNGVNLTETTTDGTYRFVGLRPSDATGYTVTETNQPVGFQDGRETPGTPFGGAAGNEVITGIVIPLGAASDGVANAGVQYNFGELIGAIRGVVFLDADRDGQRDPGEAPIPNVTVTLRDAGGTVVGTRLTNPDGSYSFDGLPGGTYTVTETQPPGYGNPPGGPFAPDVRTVVLPPGTVVTEQNFGDTLGSIAGSVFVDANGNGARDPGEPGIPAVRVTLTGTTAAGDPVAAPFDTLADGSFFFGNLPGGTYTLTETQPPAYGDGGDAFGTAGGTVTNDLITNVALPAGVDATGYTFGELGAAIAGVSYHDRNLDGAYQPGTDRPLANVTVTLRDGDGNVVGTTTTGPDGTYSFTGLRAGNYTVTETQPPGFGNTETPTNVRPVAVPPNATVGGLNFGNTLGSLAGTVYLDFDLSGTFEPANPNPERGIPGIGVTLRDAGGNVVATTTTDAAGRYRFDDLPAGAYTIAETQPPLPTTLDNGFYDGADNLGSLAGTRPAKNAFGVALGIDPNTGRSQSGVEYDFGELPPADPFGFVYHDVNRNGDKDPGEPGIPNVAVAIAGTAFAGTVFARPLDATLVPGGNLTVFTDAAGRWEFNPIPPGLYTITETQPAAYLDGRERNGDPNPPFTVGVGNDVFTNIELAPFPVRGPFLFGEFLAVAPAGPLPPMDFFPPAAAGGDFSKRQFLSSTDMTAAAAAAAPAGATAPNFAAFNPTPGLIPRLAAAAQDAGNGWVRVFDFAAGQERFRFQPYGDFGGGVRVATADVTGDGIPDVITAPGVGGGPVVRVFDGNTGAAVRTTMAFEETFRGGLQVAAGDVNGDGAADVIVTPDTGGGPIVRVFDGRTGAVIANFFALDATFRGGLRVAAGDVNRDGAADVLVTAGLGGGPRVAGYDGRTLGTTQARLFGDFFGFAPELRDGFWVSAGDADGDGFADVALGAGRGGAPRVTVYSGRLLAAGNGATALSDFFAGDPAARGGTHVRLADLDGNGRAELLAGAETAVLPRLFVFDPLTGVSRDAFYAFPTTGGGGVSLG